MKIDEFLEKYYIDRLNTNCLKWDGMDSVYGRGDLFPVWVADMDFKLPNHVIGFAKDRLNQGAFGYAITPSEYFDIFISWQKTYHGIDVSKKWIRFSTGVVQSLLYLIQIYTEENDAVIVNTPLYPPIQNAVIFNKRRLIKSELVLHKDRFIVDLSDFEEKIIGNKVKLFILCSPHNPLGKVWTEEELSDIFEVCKKYDVKIISDEIHQDFVINAPFFTSATEVQKGAFRDRIFVLNSASKTFNTATLLNSRILIPDDSLRKIYDERIERYNHTEISVIGQAIEMGAYQGARDWFDGILRIVKLNYEYVKQKFKEELPKAFVSNLEGTYLLWINFSVYLPGRKIARFMRDICNIATSEGVAFGENCEDFIRINLATSPENIRFVCDKIISEVKNRGEL